MILYINACVRTESRTNRIAKALLKTFGGEYEEVKLAEDMPEPLNETRLQIRTELIKAEMLDVEGYDAETIMQEVIEQIFKSENPE